MSAVLRVTVVRRMRRRFRCAHRGHDWLKRFDELGRSETFCRRCGRAG